MDSRFFSTTIANFSTRFCNELEKNKNVVCSPLSAELVLALLTLGSTDPARQQLLNSLGFTDDDSIRSSFSEMSSKLKCMKAVTLKIANKLYVREGSYDLDPELKDDAVKIFDAGIEKADFDDGEAAASKINTWVENQTDNKIKDLVSAEAFDYDTYLVHVNAIYFKGAWQSPFSPNLTKEQVFHLNANSTVQIPMMFKNGNFLYSHNEFLQAQLLEIPFMDNEASMLIVLPRDVEGLNSVLNKLAIRFALTSAIEKMSSTKVRVTIPKFKIETEINLKELLPKLGISAIFERTGSGLSKLINNGKSLYVSTAVQKASIEVNEDGAEAAAATYMARRFLCRQRTPPEFRADRPFLYLLLDVDRTPLFIGAYRGID